MDNDAAKVKVLQAGGIPIYEPGLEELVQKNVASDRLSFTTSTAEGVQKSDVIFIAVPTPPLPDGSVDMSFMEKVAREIAGAMTSYKIVVDKSTVPVQTGDKVAETIKRYSKARVDFDVVSNPEFLREGFAVEDLMRPDRVVVGVRSQRPVPALKEIYAPFKAPIIITDISSAELIKHASNSFLALKISYINAISVLCEATGANVQEVANGMGMDERIGRRFLQASLGFGGSCFPKDLSAFVKIAEQVGYDFRLLKEVQHINAAPDGPVREEDTGHALGAEGQDYRGAGPCVQAEYGRHPHVPCPGPVSSSAKGGRRSPRPRSQGHGESQGRAEGSDLRRGHERGSGRVRRAGDRHGVGRVQEARSGAGPQGAYAPHHVRRPESL